MFETDLSQQIQKLKEEEEKQLAEMRLKRFFEAEAMRKEIERRNEEEELKSLTAKETHLTNKLTEMRRKIFQLRVEAKSWEILAESKTKDLKTLEDTLNECYERIWANRDNFCDKIDTLLRDHTTLPKSMLPPQFADVATREEIEKLKETVSAEEDFDRVHTKTLTNLLEEKENINKSHDSERKRLEEWIQVTRDRCTELRRRIQEKRASIHTELNPVSNRLFSIVNLDDIKKLTKS